MTPPVLPRTQSCEDSELGRCRFESEGDDDILFCGTCVCVVFPVGVCTHLQNAW
jgi:hypothetical protein